MNIAKWRTLAVAGLVTGVLMSYQACSPPAASRNTAKDGFQLQNGGTTTDNPKATVDVSIMPHSVQTIQEAQICVEDVKFRKVSVESQSWYTGYIYSYSSSSRELQRAADKIADQLRGRDIYIVREGTYIDAFSIPRGNFNVVELILDDDCTANSLSLVANGKKLSTRQEVTLRFDGVGVSDSVNLQLNMQPILEALSRAKSNDDIDDILDDVRGTFQ